MDQERFDCSCGGPIKVIDATHVEHMCASKDAHGTTYYGEEGEFMPWVRYHIYSFNYHTLTDDPIKYKWFAAWEDC